jgi:hypothetical protein
MMVVVIVVVVVVMRHDNIPDVIGPKRKFNAAATAMPPSRGASVAAFGTEREASGEHPQARQRGKIDYFVKRSSTKVTPYWNSLSRKLGVGASGRGQNPALSHGHWSGRFGFGGRRVGDAVSIADRPADRPRIVKGDDAKQTDGGVHRRAQQQTDRE